MILQAGGFLLVAMVVLGSQGAAAVNPVVLWHGLFTLGLLPLMLGAIIHFVPVLTRSAGPSRGIGRLPWVAQALGVGVVTALAGGLPRWTLGVWALAELLVVLVLLRWIMGRARRCLGAPHPGWRWYGLALVCLALGIAAIPGLLAWPEYYSALRRWHLHLNLLGFVGLTALGTLPVLLPTALGQGDPGASPWLRKRGPWAAAGGLLVALGSGGSALDGGPPGWAAGLSLLGALLLMAVGAELLLGWRRRFGLMAIHRRGAAAALVVALLGLLLLLAGGIVHGLGGEALLPGERAVGAWILGFLLPLVTGALSQLLPVWRYPGPAGQARRQLQTALGRWGALRAWVFLLAAGLWWGLGADTVAMALAALALAQFCLQFCLMLGASGRAG